MICFRHVIERYEIGIQIEPVPDITRYFRPLEGIGGAVFPKTEQGWLAPEAPR